MRYYGCKTKLLPFIEEVVRSTGVNGSSNFVDLFSGTSSVGMHFKKMGYTVISNDNLEFAYALSKTYIELNDIPKFKKLKKFLGIVDSNNILFEYLNDVKSNEVGFIQANYSPIGNRKYFTEENANKIDNFRYLIHVWKDSDLIDESEYYYLLTCLLESVNLVSNVSGTYAAFLKKWDNRALKSIIFRPVSIIPSKTKNKAFKMDANELIGEIKPDILYLDPPYNNRQYASNYFLLELIAKGWFDEEPEIYGKTGMIDYSDKKSLYCTKGTAEVIFKDLIDKSIKAQYLLLSYNNEGIIDKVKINNILSNIGNVHLYQEDHKRYRSINQSDKDPKKTKEYLYLVKPKNLKNNINNLSSKQWFENTFSIWKNLSKNAEELKLKHPAIFTVKLVSKLIDTYCKPNGNVVLDCFAGSGTTLIAGLIKGKNVIGFDIQKDYKKVYQQRVDSYNQIEKNCSEKSKYFICDSKKLSDVIDENSVDICITSPPYWDILNRDRSVDLKNNINYSNFANDLGNIDSYELFIIELEKVFKNVYMVLRDKSYFIVNVMDLRKKSIFYPYHMDVTLAARNSGFKLEDIIIWDRQSEYNNLKPIGYPYKFIVNKIHEYLLIFRKELS